MDLIFAACVDLKDQYSGITRKVITEYNVLQKNFNSCLVGYYGNGIKIIEEEKESVLVDKKKHRRILLIETVTKIISKEHCKYAYIRRMPCNPLVISMLRHIKRNGATKIVWEIPTYPYDHEGDEKTRSFSSKMVSMMEKIYRKQLRRYVTRIVTFSNYQNIFGIKTINTGNGIDVESISPRVVRQKDDVLNLIAVAVLENWHGYDRLIRGLGKYYKENGNRNIVFHLVGDGNCLSQYKEMAERFNLKNHVVFYGYMTKKEIDNIYDKCDIAVESLGWHRSKVSMGTSIKTREYLAKGLPIVASTPMDIFPEGWKYAYYAPIDDSPIDINEVLHFYDEIVSIKPEKELAEEIRNIAVEKCDMSVTMKSIIDYYLE